MKALAFHGPRHLAHESVADPRIETPGDVLIRVERTAICGSDLHVFLGRETGLDAGTVMGHEFVGEVIETGGAVRGLERGTRVLSPFSTSCGACFYCSSGLTSRCESGQLFGWVENGAGLHGAQAEFVRVPLAESTLMPIPEDVTADEALLLGDVASTGYFCALRAAVEPGGTYVVIGCGPVGLMAIVGARELGAERVFALDSIAERLELARSFGATPLDYTSVDVPTVVREATEGRGADAALEAVGNASAHRVAADLVRPGGTISVVGVHNEERFSFTPAEAYDKNLTYRVGRCPARDMIPRLLPIVRSKRHDIARIISHRLPLAEGVAAYDLFEDKRDACTKVVLQP